MTSTTNPNCVINSLDYVEQIVQDSYLSLLVEDALDWSQCFGLVLRTKEHKDRSDICQNAPFALLPSPFPRLMFHQAIDIQKEMNLLYFKISWDYGFLLEAHRDVIKSDDFTKKMVQILQQIYKDGIKQRITLLTQRADYMCHVDKNNPKFQLKQIEVNHIAVSMGGLAQKATLLHRRILSKLGKKITKEMVPDNNPILTLANGIFTAWKLFGNSNAITLIVVADVNQNQFDQRYVEYGLEELSNGEMHITRLTFTECAERLQLNDENYNLVLDGIITVAVVYFRTGYSPEDYHSDKEWNTRLLMEKSTAIKCPWIGLQLANTKKVQQILSKPGVLEKFFGDQDVVSNIRNTFAKMWGLEKDDAETAQIIEDALLNPHKYVLKPQVEGGGGNYFDQQIVQKLKQFTFVERASHILMQRITPLIVKNYLIRAFQQPKLEKVVSELGIYGCLIGDGADMSVKYNQVGGHILRTKSEHINEGGVAIGAAVIDTPFLL